MSVFTFFPTRPASRRVPGAASEPTLTHPAYPYAPPRTATEVTAHLERRGDGKPVRSTVAKVDHADTGCDPFPAMLAGVLALSSSSPSVAAPAAAARDFSSGGGDFGGGGASGDY